MGCIPLGLHDPLGRAHILIPKRFDASRIRVPVKEWAEHMDTIKSGPEIRRGKSSSQGISIWQHVGVQVPL